MANDQLTHDLNFIFDKAQRCRVEHQPIGRPDAAFCFRCLDELRSVLTIRTSMNFILTESDICALFRQLDRHHLTHEGRSGPQVHDLLTRLQNHVGRDRVREYVSDEWPERLK
jgi:hypothetical protein